MESVRSITFDLALAELGSVMGRETRIQIGFRDTMAGACLEGRLSGVETIGSSGDLIAVLLDDRQSLMLDRTDTEILAIEKPDGERLLRFHLPSGVVATVEPSVSAVPAIPRL